MGSARPGWRDAYHALLRMPWWAAIGVIVFGYLALNALFAVGYWADGGIANARPGSLLDAFDFSIQTMGTIGYGSMHPTSRIANALVATESVLGLVVTALATGLVFVRFSRVRGRVVFADRATVSPIDGVPTLMIRFGNERSNRIYDAEIRVTVVRTVRTAEGVTLYRNEDLPLVRSRAADLRQSWMVMHQIDASSPLFGATPESLASQDAEIQIALSGLDDQALQPVHARRIYEMADVAWGARYADVLTETEDGDLVLDLTRFHDIVPSEPTTD